MMLVSGPSRWTRTTTSRVKSPACSVHTTKGKWSEWRDSNPHLKAWKARRRPLPHIRIWFGLRVSIPSLRAGNAGCIPPHPGRTWTGVVHRPIAIRQLSKTPLLRAWWAARDSNPIAPLGRTGLRPVSGPSARTARWRQRQDSNADQRALEARMLPLHHAVAAALTSRPYSETNLPVTWRGLLPRRAKNKKGLLGDRPRRPGSQ
jgi:hypothetical protein